MYTFRTDYESYYSGDAHSQHVPSAHVGNLDTKTTTQSSGEAADVINPSPTQLSIKQPRCPTGLDCTMTASTASATKATGNATNVSGATVNVINVSDAVVFSIGFCTGLVLGAIYAYGFPVLGQCVSCV